MYYRKREHLKDRDHPSNDGSRPQIIMCMIEWFCLVLFFKKWHGFTCPCNHWAKIYVCKRWILEMCEM